MFLLLLLRLTVAVLLVAGLVAICALVVGAQAEETALCAEAVRRRLLGEDEVA